MEKSFQALMMVLIDSPEQEIFFGESEGSE
jgi:hypothetical protein